MRITSTLEVLILKTKLELARKQMGLSQMDLAKMVGISIRSYKNYELGKREPKVGIAIKMAMALNVDVSKLFSKTDIGLVRDTNAKLPSRIFSSLLGRDHVKSKENTINIMGDFSQIAGDVFSQIERGDNSQLAGGDYSQIIGGHFAQLAGGVKAQLSGGDGSQVAGSACAELKAGCRSQLAGGDCAKLEGDDCSQLVGGAYSRLSGGKNSLIIGDRHSIARGKKGTIILIVNRDKQNNIIDYSIAHVDGEKIKEDVFYKLENGKFVEK